jgi:hypothetical protein
MAQERCVFRKSLSHATIQRKQTDQHRHQRDQNIDRKQRAQIQSSAAGWITRVLPAPMRARPNQIESRLNRCVEIRARAGQFRTRPAKVERDDPPDQFGMFERFVDQFPKDRRIIAVHAPYLTRRASD